MKIKKINKEKKKLYTIKNLLGKKIIVTDTQGNYKLRIRNLIW